MVNNINGFTQGAITTGKQSEPVQSVSAENQQQAAAPGAAAKEPIEISSQAQLLSRLEAQIKDLPEVNQSRVDTLREQVNQGTFEIDVSSLAQRIIDLEF
jgi:negative regulator of flagellin synthesis FlgM